MSATWVVIATTELRLIMRNKVTAVSATVLPLAFAVLFLLTGLSKGEGASAVAVVQLMALQLITVYATGTTTLAARRQQLYLKRLRSSPASVASIVAGLMAPLVGIAFVQAIVMVSVTGLYLGELPARPWMLVVAMLVGGVMCAALAFLTAAFTKTPEAAQLTTTPAFVALIVGAVAVASTPPALVSWFWLSVPGGALAQLARTAWGGNDLVQTALPALGLSLLPAAAAVAIAIRVFRWEPRS